MFDPSNMSEKIHTAEGLFNLFSDKDKLKEYFHHETSAECDALLKFQLELPYDKIKAKVEEEGKLFLSKLPEPDKSKVRWEHIGSTSIKGMPGMPFPDALTLIEQFPPNQNVIQAFLDAGYYFGHVSVLDAQDLWFFKIFNDGFLKDHMITIHVMTPDNKAGKILLDTRDMCRSEPWAFEDYKSAKIEAAKAKSIIGYKMGKGNKSKLLEMLREKHGGINTEMMKKMAEDIMKESKLPTVDN